MEVFSVSAPRDRGVGEFEGSGRSLYPEARKDPGNEGAFLGRGQEARIEGADARNLPFASVARHLIFRYAQRQPQQHSRGVDARTDPLVSELAKAKHLSIERRMPRIDLDEKIGAPLQAPGV